MDTLEYTNYLYAKFQASTTSENLSVLTQKCDFSTKITEKGHFSHLTRSKGLLELSNLAQKTSSSSSLIAQNFMGTAKEKLARKCCKMLQNTAKTWSFQHFWTWIVEKMQHWRKIWHWHTRVHRLCVYQISGLHNIEKSVCVNSKVQFLHQNRWKRPFQSSYTVIKTPRAVKFGTRNLVE